MKSSKDYSTFKRDFLENLIQIQDYRPQDLSVHCNALNSFSSIQMCVFISHTGNIHRAFWRSSLWGDILAVRGQDYNRPLIEIRWRLRALLLLLVSLTVQEAEEPPEKEAGREDTHTARVEDIRILACVVHQHAWEMQKENQGMSGCKADQSDIIHPQCWWISLSSN